MKIRVLDIDREMKRYGMNGNCKKCIHYHPEIKCIGGPEIEAVCKALLYAECTFYVEEPKPEEEDED